MKIQDEVTLAHMPDEMAKYMKRRECAVPKWRHIRVVFSRWKGFTLAELFTEKGRKRIGTGVSKRSVQCQKCHGGADTENTNTGRVVALYRALDDMRAANP